MTKKTYFCFLLFTFITIDGVVGQTTDFKNLIIGEWKSYKDEIYGLKESPSKLLSSGDKEHQEMHLKLMHKGKGFDYSIEVNFQYQLQSNKLLLGNRDYTIEKLTEQELVIVTVANSTSIARYRYFFKRVDENKDH